MKCFFDTSALTKRYVQEEGTQKVNEIFEEATVICVSALCLPEVFSALNRLKWNHLIRKDQYTQIKQNVLTDFNELQVCHLNSDVISKGVNLLENYPLKTLDALQLASYLQSQMRYFISSDKKQINVARKLKMETRLI